MPFKAQWYRDKLAKKRQKGFRGYPVATLAFYGSDDKRASKLSVGIVPSEGADPAQLERWYMDTTDARSDQPRPLDRGSHQVMHASPGMPGNADVPAVRRLPSRQAAL